MGHGGIGVSADGKLVDLQRSSPLISPVPTREEARNASIHEESSRYQEGNRPSDSISTTAILPPTMLLQV